MREFSIPYPPGCDPERVLGIPLPGELHLESVIRFARFEQQVSGFEWVRRVSFERATGAVVVRVGRRLPKGSVGVLTALYHTFLPDNARVEMRFDDGRGRWKQHYVEQDGNDSSFESRLRALGADR